MKALLLTLALTVAAVQVSAGMKTLPCGARVPDDMDKAKRIARSDWALPSKASAPIQQKKAVTARAADSSKQ